MYRTETEIYMNKNTFSLLLFCTYYYFYITVIIYVFYYILYFILYSFLCLFLLHLIAKIIYNLINKLQRYFCIVIFAFDLTFRIDSPNVS